MAINETMHPEAIKLRIAKASSLIETMFVGTITSVDPVNLKYSVQPATDKYDMYDKKVVKSAVIFECPMMSNKCGSFFIRMPYQVGDMVYVGVCKDPIDESLSSSEPKLPTASGVSQFRQSDGVILGGILSSYEEKLSSSNAKDFLIQNRKNGDKIVMFNGGGIEMTTGTKVTINSPETDISGNVNIAGNINVVGDGVIGTVTTKAGVTLDGHTHKYNPGPGAPTPTGTGEG
jgi:hypothetical protein